MTQRTKKEKNRKLGFIKIKNNLILVGKGSKCIFLPRINTNSQQAHKKLLNIIHLQGNTNQTIARYCFTSKRTAIIQKPQHRAYGQGSRETGNFLHLHTASEHIKWYSHFRTQLQVPQEVTHMSQQLAFII